MNSGKARDLFEKYATAMVYVAVEKPNGDQGIGSAFHVGEGVFVTARHVVEDHRILEIASTERTYIKLEGVEAESARCIVHVGDDSFPAHILDNGVLSLSKGPFFHPDDSVDVAVFQVVDIDSRTPYIPLGSHLDDWLGTSDFVLTEAIVLGYPPIPLTQAPHLFAARAEVNALIDVRDTSHVHFVLSAMPRGGFSGGVAITEFEFVLGVVTRSLLSSNNSEELGFFSVLSVEPIYTCLAAHKLLPDRQAEGWEDFWNSDRFAIFYDPKNNPEAPRSVSAKAELTLFDDGKRVHLGIMCNDPALYEAALSCAESQLESFHIERVVVRNGLVKVRVTGDYVKAREAISLAAEAACTSLIEAGLERSIQDPAILKF